MALLLLAGCNDPLRFRLAHPDWEAESVLYLFYDGTNPQVGYGWSTGEAPVAVDLSSEQGWAYALTYDRSLACLGLPAGEFSIGGGQLGALHPGPPSGLYGANLVAGSVAELLPIEAGPPEITQLIEPNEGCAQLNSEVLEVPGSLGQQAALLTPIDDDSALLGLGNGLFFRITASAVEPLPQLPPETPHLGAFRTESGELWLVGAGGVMARGNLSDGFRLVSTATVWTLSPLPDAQDDFLRAWVDGAGEGDQLELFAVVSEAGFFRYVGGQWQALDHRLPHREEDSFGANGVAWIGPGEGVAVGLGNLELTRYRDGRISPERLEDAGLAPEPGGLLRHPRLGVVAGARDGSLHLYREGAWRGIGGATQSVTRVLAAHGDWILHGGQNGSLHQFLPGGPKCEPQRVTDRHLTALTWLPGPQLFVVIGRTYGAEAVKVARLRLSRNGECR